MKKSKFLFLCIVAQLLFMASCTKESYFHSLSLGYPSKGITYIYADQTSDSIVIWTTDDVQITSNASWLGVPDDKAYIEVPNYYRVVSQVLVYLSASRNTTGEPRMATVSVRSAGADDWSSNAAAIYYQVPWLNIRYPYPSYEYNDNGLLKKATFQLKEPALRELSDTLRFEVNEDWKLTDGKFLHPAQTLGFKGVQKVALLVDENTTEVERKDTLMLDCAGIRTMITCVQEAKKKDKE